VIILAPDDFIMCDNSGVEPLNNVLTVKGESVTFQCPIPESFGLMWSQYRLLFFWKIDVLHPKHINDPLIIEGNNTHPYYITIFPTCKSEGDKDNFCNCTNQLYISEVSLNMSYFKLSCCKFYEYYEVEFQSATVSKCIIYIVIFMWYFVNNNVNKYKLCRNLSKDHRSSNSGNFVYTSCH